MGAEVNILLSRHTTKSVDQATAHRIRGEWQKLVAALKDKGNAADHEIDDPLGEDGNIAVRMAFFKAEGGGEVLLRKGTPPRDRRYTRLMAQGDTLEKTSYVMKEDGHREFHKRTVQAGDQVTYQNKPESEDQAWIDGLE